MIMSGCTGVAKIRERYHRAPFEKTIEKGDYTIILYNLEYPENYMEKIKFHNDLNILVKKFLIYDRTVNENTLQVLKHFHYTSFNPSLPIYYTLFNI